MRPNDTQTQGSKSYRRENAIRLIKAIPHTKISRGDLTTIVAIAKEVGVSPRTLYRWKSEKKTSVMDGKKFMPKKAGMNSDKIDRLNQLLVDGARNSNYPDDHWSCKRIAEQIKKQLGVTYHVNHIGRLMHSLGWSASRPKVYSTQRQSKHFDQWRGLHWFRE